MFVGKPERKRPFERTRRRWEDDVTIVIKETGLESKG